MESAPAQTHTLGTLRSALVTHKPQLAPVIDTVFDTFTKPTTPASEIAEQLKTMLQRDITTGETEGARTFTWRNPSNQAIVLTIPHGEEDNPEAPDAPKASTQDQDAPTAEAPTPDAREGTPTAADHSEQSPDGAASQDENTPSEPPQERVNLLNELDVLLDDANLHLIIQRTGERDGHNVLSITVVPQAKNDKTDPALLTPINLKGTARELEDGLIRAIRISTDGNDSIEEALADLEAAKKEAAAAKKAEANKARKTSSRSTRAAKKEEEKPAEAATPSLFDTPATKNPSK